MIARRGLRRVWLSCISEVFWRKLGAFLVNTVCELPSTLRICYVLNPEVTRLLTKNVIYRLACECDCCYCGETFRLLDEIFAHVDDHWFVVKALC